MIGYGTIVALGTSITSVGKITNVSISGMSRDEIDNSSADSTNMVKVKEAGMVDTGKATFTMRFDGAASANQSKVAAAFAAGTIQNCKVTFKDTSTIDGDGFVSKYDPADLSYDGDVTFSWEFTFTELPTFTVASA